MKAHAFRNAIRRRAKGQAVIESTLTIILFTLLLGIMVSFCAFLYFQQALVTAAREGARQASLTDDLDKDRDDVVAYVENMVLRLTGQSFAGGAGEVLVSGPDPSPNPDIDTVTVTIRYNMKNPVGVAGMMKALGGSGDAFRVIPVVATATMRYED